MAFGVGPRTIAGIVHAAERKSEAGFAAARAGTVDEVITRFTDRFIGHDRLEWEYTIWLNLTEVGQKHGLEIETEEALQNP